MGKVAKIARMATLGGSTGQLRAPLASLGKQLKAPSRVQAENAGNDLPIAPNAIAVKPKKKSKPAGIPPLHKTISQAMLAGK